MAVWLSMCISCVAHQASSKDLNAFFNGLGTSWIEWLNGVSLNIMFDDAFTAERALHMLSVPIPVVEGLSGLSRAGSYPHPRCQHRLSCRTPTTPWLSTPAVLPRCEACEPRVAHRRKATEEAHH